MAKPTGPIELGDSCEDQVTGFKGVVIGITQWLHGCRRMVVQPQGLLDGKPIDVQTFDEQQLKLLKKAVVATTAPVERPVQAEVSARRTGGPRPEPTRPQVKRFS